VRVHILSDIEGVAGIVKWEGAKRALSDLSAVAPWDPGSPCEIGVECLNTTSPDRLRFRAGVDRVDDRTIVSRADTWWQAWTQFYF
jgi:D-aminopeptidase